MPCALLLDPAARTGLAGPAMITAGIRALDSNLVAKLLREKDFADDGPPGPRLRI